MRNVSWVHFGSAVLRAFVPLSAVLVPHFDIEVHGALVNQKLLKSTDSFEDPREKSTLTDPVRCWFS